MVAFSKILGGAAVASGILAIFAFVKAYRYAHEFRDTFREMGLDELPHKGWLGGWTLYKNGGGDLFSLELGLIKQYGKLFGYFEGRQPVIMVGDPQIVKQIMITDHEHFVDRRAFFPSKDKPIDLQLSRLTGTRWKHVRQQLTPAFTPAKLRQMAPLLQKVANQFVANIRLLADKGETFDAKEYCTFFTLDAIASVAFALEIDSFNNQQNEFVMKAKRAFRSFPVTGNAMALMLMFPDYFYAMLKFLPLLALMYKMFQFFQDVTEKEMERRRKTGEISKRHDFLSQVMPLEKDPNDPANKPFLKVDEMGRIWLSNGLTRNEIFGQSVLFFLAGYETTSTTLSMALLALGENPEIQEKLFQELHGAFANGRPLTMDSLNDVNYLDMVINETLRCYTPLLRVERLCTSETVLNGLKIPKGVLMALPINALHHDPDYWSDPERFDPERFSKDNEGSFPKDSFIPFGAGNRNCLGMRLAMLELKIALTRLLLEFKFTLSPETKQPIRWQANMFRTPQCPIMLVPEKRLK